jgi:hypothetical protein
MEHGASSTRLRAVHSGGQTGVDRAGLDVAMQLGLETGGFCPKGRTAEDGTIPAIYPLTELNTSKYPLRTRLNIESTDGTLVLHNGNMGPGTKLTIRIAKELGKPLLIVNTTESPPSKEFAQWLDDNKIEKLNVAGPRASEKNPRMYEEAMHVFRELCLAAIDLSTPPRDASESD